MRELQAPLLRAEGGRHGVLVREGLLLERGIEGIVEVVPAVLLLLLGEGDEEEQPHERRHRKIDGRPDGVIRELYGNGSKQEETHGA